MLITIFNFKTCSMMLINRFMVLKSRREIAMSIRYATLFLPRPINDVGSLQVRIESSGVAVIKLERVSINSNMVRDLIHEFNGFLMVQLKCFWRIYER